MKKFFLSRSDPRKLKTALVLMLISVIIAAICVIAGINNTVLLFDIGCILFIYALLYLWGKAYFYAILGFVYMGGFLLLTLGGWGYLIKNYFPDTNAEDFCWITGAFCLFGAISTVIGYCVIEKSWKRLPVAGAMFSALVVPLIVFSMPPHPRIRYFIPVNEISFSILQLLITLMIVSILFLYRNYKVSKIIIIITSVILAVQSLWGFAENFIYGFFNAIVLVFVLMTLNKLQEQNRDNNE